MKRDGVPYDKQCSCHEREANCSKLISPELPSYRRNGAGQDQKAERTPPAIKTEGFGLEGPGI